MSDPIGRHRWRIAAAALLLATLAAAPAAAQGRDHPWFRIYNWDGEVAFDVRNRFDTLETTDRETVDKNESILGEEFTIGSDGWFYHPNLLRFSSEIGLEFDQDIVRTTPETEKIQVDAMQLNFDLNIGLLPEKPYPITLFASRSRSEIDPPFTERRTIDALRYGAGVHLRNLAVGEYEVPAQFFYRHFDTQTDGRFSNDRVRDEVEIQLDNETARSRSRLEYDWESLETDSEQAMRTTDRHTLRANHDYYMENGGQFSSQALFSSYDANDFNVLSTTVNENLSLVHGPNLRSNYGYSFSLQDSDSNHQMTHGAFAGISHQLYASLTSSASAGGSFSSSDLGDILRLNGGLGFNYTKKIPGGILGLRFLPSYAFQDENVKPGTSDVFDEVHAADLNPEFQLDEFCVIESSIEIRDSATSVPLVSAQFILLPRSGECSPTRILITDAAILGVEVDYRFRILPARTYTTRVLGTGLSVSLWEHLFFDISYVDTQLDLLDGVEENSTLSDSQLLLAHLDLNFDHNRTRLEFERLRDDISPRDRFSIFHDFSYQPTPRSTLGLGAKYEYDKLTDANRTTNVFALTADGTAWFPFGVLGRLNLFARYLAQKEQDSLAAGGFVSLAYRYGWLRFELQEHVTWSYSKTKRGPSQVTKELLNDFYFRVSRPF